MVKVILKLEEKNSSLLLKLEGKLFIIF